MEVKSTKRYHKFSFLRGNRNIDRPHVATLKKSMETYPDLFQARPILVNEHMQIIDGQHRFEAAQELGVPIWYMVVQKLDVQDAQLMNVNQLNWSPIDFARHFATLGNQNYVEYLKLRETFPELSHFAAVTVLNSDNRTGKDSTTTVAFKLGNFVAKNKDVAYETAARLVEIKNIYPSGMLKALVQALTTIMRLPKYNHKRMVKAIKNYGHIFLTTSHGNKKEYLIDLEHAYNHRYNDKNRVRFL